MRNFEWATPTRVIFGTGILEKLGKDAAGLGRRALLVYGRQSIRQNGLYDRICAQLSQAGIAWVDHGGVQPNPRLAHAIEGAQKARQFQADFIIAAGGGSVIDESKAIAVGACNEAPLWDYFTRKALFSAALPIIAIQTQPATSSELNGAAVITNDETKEKFSIRSLSIYPKLAFLDPSLTLDIPVRQTAYSCVDILAHMMEGYLTAAKDNPIQDGMTEAVCRAVMDAMERILQDPHDLDARATIMWGGAIAWNGLLAAGVDGASIPNHMLEHPLSGLYDITHGAGLSIVFPAWMRYRTPVHGRRIIRFGTRILGLEGLEQKSEAEAAAAVIDALKAWYRHIGSPVSLSEAGIHELDIESCADQAVALCRLWGVSGYSREEIVDMYRLMA